MRLRATLPRTDSPSGLDRSDRFALWLLLALAALVGVAITWSAVLGVLSSFDDTTTVGLSATSPVPASAATGPATIVSGAFDHAIVVVAGIDVWSRIALAASSLVSSLSSVAVAVTVVVLCRAILAGRPFVRSVTWLLTTASLALIGGSLIGAGLNTVATFSIASALNPEPWDTVFPLANQYDFSPLLIGVVLGAVAVAFHMGQKMQRDTDGLV